MAAPTVNNWTSGVQSSDVYEHTISLPSGIQAGERLIVIFSVDGNPSISIETGYSGNGWTLLDATAYSTTCSAAIATKVATGSDALKFRTLGASGAQQSSHISYRISAANCVEFAVASGAASNTPNPPTKTHGGGSVDTLWIAACCNDHTDVASSGPASYGNLHTQAGSSSGASVSTADYTPAAGDTQDPGTFTLASSQTEEWVCYTIAIYAGTESKGRSTQVVSEVVSNENPKGRTTQLVAEIVSNEILAGRTTQVVAEVVSSETTKGRATQVVAEVVSGFHVYMVVDVPAVVATITTTGAKGAKGSAGTLTAAATLTATGKKGGQGPATLTAAATLSATGKRTVLGTASASAAQSITSTGKKGGKGTASMTAAATVASTSKPGAKGTASLTAAATVTATGKAATKAVATITTAATVSGTGRGAHNTSASVTATPTTDAAGFKDENVAYEGTAEITHAPTVTATGTHKVTATASLTAAATLTATGRENAKLTATITQATSLAATGQRGAKATAQITVAASVSSTYRANHATDVAVRVGFTSPSKTLYGTQTFNVLVRKDGTHTWATGTPTVDIELWDDGSLVRVLLSGQSVTSDSGQVVSATWDASEVSGDPQGVNVECRVVGHVGGTGDNRRTVEVGAIEWIVRYPAAVAKDGAATVTPVVATTAAIGRKGGVGIVSLTEAITTSAFGVKDLSAGTGSTMLIICT